MPAHPPVVDDLTLASARAGNRDGLALIWRTHQAQLLRYLRAKRVANAEDVASQVWIDVAGSISRFDGNGNDFRAWLFTIAHRRSVDEVRKAIRRPEVLDDRVGELVHDVQGADQLDAVGAIDRSISLVRQLSPDMAEAVMLRVVYDMDISDVAEVMQRSEGNVRVLVHRGLKQLRTIVAGANDSALAFAIVS